jgi:hypothetical protein
MNRCILCSGSLDPCNVSGICLECRVIIRNLLDVTIEERWKDAAIDVDGVIVSDRGRVARLLNVNTSHAYPRVSVGGRRFYLHSLVCGAFKGPRPAGALVLHRDDDPDNPNADNLRYGDHLANAQDRKRNRRKEHR